VDLANVNVASAVEKPRVARAEFSVLTPDQVNTLLAKIRDDRLFTLYLLAIFTGLRQGELLALAWADVNLDDCRLEVRYTLEPTSLERVEVKTRRGRRRVDLSPTLVTELRAHRQRMLAEGHPHSLVFPTKGGEPIKGSTLRTRMEARTGARVRPAREGNDHDRQREQIHPGPAAGRHPLPRPAAHSGDAHAAGGGAPEGRERAARPRDGRHDARYLLARPPEPPKRHDARDRTLPRVG